MAEKIDVFLKRMEKEYGEGVLKRGTDPSIAVKRISSGIMPLDIALGGGFGKGRLIEIAGPKGSGKTSIALNTVASIQREGGRATLIDLEHTYDETWARILGVDTDSLFVVQGGAINKKTDEMVMLWAERALDIATDLINSGEMDLIVLDSVAALVPKAEFEEDSLEDNHMALLARVFGKFIKKNVGSGALVNNGCTLICINQLRSTMSLYGPKDVHPGGRALEFYATQQLAVRTSEFLEGDVQDPETKESLGKGRIGATCNVKVEKNKISSKQYQTAAFNIIYGLGVDHADENFQAALYYRIIEQRGAWFYFGERAFQGKKEVLGAIATDVEFREQLLHAISEKMQEYRE